MPKLMDAAALEVSLLKGPGTVHQRCHDFYLLLENGGPMAYCFPESWMNLTTPRLKGRQSRKPCLFSVSEPKGSEWGWVLSSADSMHSHAVLPVKVLTVAWHRPLDAQPQLGHILPQPLSGLAYKVYE